MLWLASILSLVISPFLTDASPRREITFTGRVDAQVAIDRVQAGHLLEPGIPMTSS
ncbi:MAG: hypothetical protein ACREAA_19905 [Candidatus Polarisedimenticolia bacterium]